MALLFGRGTSPEGPTAEGIASNCNNYVTVSAGNSCEVLANQAGVTLDQFYQWNPSLQNSCAGLLVGYAYCVGILEGTTTASITVQTTASPITAAPTHSATKTGTSTSTAPFETPLPTGSTLAISKTLFWQIHQKDGECQSPTGISLWFLSLWIFPCLWTLILGSRDLQGWVRNRTKLFRTAKGLERQCLSICITVALQVSMTVVTAQLLRSSVPEGAYPPQLWRIVMAWFIRPLPATAVSVVSFMSPSMYVCSASMQQITEAIYGLVSIGPYAVLARHVSPTDYVSRTLPPGPIRKGYRLVQGGAIAGMALWCLCLLGALWGGMSVWRRHKENGKKKFYYVAVSSAVFNLTRVLAGFLIWNGALLLDPGSFCVGGRTMGSITALLAVVPVAELLVQAVLS